MAPAVPARHGYAPHLPLWGRLPPAVGRPRQRPVPCINTIFVHVQMAVETLAVTTDGGPCAVILRGIGLPVMLPIVIAPNQAAAIAAVNFSFPRPLTHDLLLTLLDELGGKVERVVIHDVQEQTFHARISIARSNGDPVSELDCRPSDAIALAVRLGMPILVSGDVLSRAEGVRWGQESQGVPGEDGDALDESDAGTPFPSVPAEPPVSSEQLEPFRAVVEKLDLDGL